MLTVDHRLEESLCGPAVHPCSKKLVHLDKHDVQDHKIPTELGKQCSRQPMSFIPTIGCGQQRAGVGNDLH